MMLGVYHDDPTSVAPEQLRSDAAVSVPEGVALPDGLAEQRIPAGRYASAVHRGPYDGLRGAWEWFTGQWFPGSGQRPRGSVVLEIYRNDPTTTPAAELETELLVPIE